MHANGQSTNEGNDHRVLVLLQKSRDTESLLRVLSNIDADALKCATWEELCAETGRGAGALLLEEEAFSANAGGCLRLVLDSQPSWSELPIIVLLRHAPQARAVTDELVLPGDVTFLERPVRVKTLVSIIRSALRSRRRQYLLRDQLTVLKETQGRLEAANRELETFNYTVAHDLRKPLTIMNGYAQILEEVAADALDEQCRGYIHEMYEGTVRMNRLIDVLLEFSRLARAEPKREQVNISRICEEVALELKLAEGSRPVTLRIEPGVVAEADPDLLRVVLHNLVGNAWKYTVMQREAVIEFGTTEADGTTAFFVRDNGRGFSMADANKLFAPFQRLPGSEGQGGSGIGLATVERVIHRHGGRVWAEAEPGKGATFYFTLAGMHAGEGPERWEGQ